MKKNYLFINCKDIELDFDARDFEDAVGELAFHLQCHDEYNVETISDREDKVDIFLKGHYYDTLLCSERPINELD